MKGQAVKKAEQEPQSGKKEATHYPTPAASDELSEKEPEHHSKTAPVNDLDPNILLASPEFQRDLDIVCQSVFKQFGPSQTYSEWLDLRQETSFNFVPWLKNYQGKATLKSILNRIATNLCIDEVRRQKSRIRAHVEINLDEIDLETLRNPITEDTDRRILFEECRSQFSGEKLVIFDEFFTEGRSLREIARRHRFSPQTAVNQFAQILRKLRQFVLGQNG